MTGQGMRQVNGDPAAMPMSNGGYITDQHHTFAGGLSGANTSGNVYYVDRNVGTTGNGKTWSTAFKTFKEAITAVNADYAAGTRNDYIYVGEGWYSETPSTLTAHDVTIVGTAPGNHDSTVLYGSATAGGFDITSGGPALTILGDNNTIANMGLFTYDVLYASLQIGDTTPTTTTGTSVLNCSFIRDQNNASLGGIRDYGADATLVDGCFFSTSCKDWGIWNGTNGQINPVNAVYRNCKFTGVPTGVDTNASAHNTSIYNCVFIDDTSDRPGTVTVPVEATGSVNPQVWNCYSEFANADIITNGTSPLAINNFKLATPA